MATHTVKQSGGDFSNLNAALQDSGTGTGDEVAIQGTWSAVDSNSWTISDSSIDVTTDSDSKFPGYVPASPTHYRNSVSNGDHCGTISGNSASLTGLHLIQAGTGASDECIRIGASGTHNFDDCAFSSPNSYGDQDGIYGAGYNITMNITNCMAWGLGRAAFHAAPGNNTQTWNIKCCTVYDCNNYTNETNGGAVNAYSNNAGATINLNLFNNSFANAATNSTSKDINDGTTALGTHNWTIDRCIYDTIHANCGTPTDSLSGRDATDSDSPGTGDWVVYEDITSATPDLRLKDNAENDAQDAHSDSTGAGLSMPSDDIVGTTRPQNTNYDIGAFEIEETTTQGASTDGVDISDTTTATATYGYSSTVDNTNGGPTYRWKFNSNLTAHTGGVNWTVTGGTAAYVSTIISEDFGNCLDASGSLELNMANQSDINTSNTTRKELSLWIKPDTVTGNQGIFEEGGGTNWVHLYLEGGTLYWNVGEGGASGSKGHVTCSGLQAGSVYHIIASMDCGDATLRMVVNGVEYDGSHTLGSALSSHSGDITLCRTADPRDHNGNSGGKGYFDGKIADFCYWAEKTSLMSVADAQAIYNAGKGAVTLQGAAVDGFDLSDTIAAIFQTASSATDGVDSSDSVSVTLTAQGQSADGVTNSDSISAIATLVGAIVDQIDTSDSPSGNRIIPASLLDALTASDSNSAIADAISSALDGVDITDDPESIKSTLAELTDGVLSGDVAEAVINAIASAIDAASLSDASEGIASAFASVVDGSLLAESISAVIIASVDVPDGVDISDVCSTIGTLLANVTGGVISTDSILATAQTLAAVIDAISTLDENDRAAYFQGATSDGTTFAEVLATVVSAVSSALDGIDLTDYSEYDSDLSVSVIDGMSASDSSTSRIDAVALTESGVQLSEAIAVIVSALSYASDQVTYTDTALGVKSTIASLVQGITVGDISTTAMEFLSSVIDGISISEQVDNLLFAVAASVDAITNADSVIPSVVFTLQCSDGLGISETTSVLLKAIAAANDALDIADFSFIVTVQGEVKIYFTLQKASVTINMV